MASSSNALSTQSINGVSGVNGTQIVAGTVHGDVIFAGAKNTAQSSDNEIRASRDALFLTDPATDRANLISAKGKRVPGTCEWILENEVYVNWSQGDIDLLSICGGPGQGKTMLSIFLSEELQRDSQTIYYFCSSESERRNSAICVLRSLLYQMITMRPELAQPLLPDLDTPTMAAASLTSREALWKMFAQLCAQPSVGKVFCILDGLDECDDDSYTWLTAKLVDLLASGQKQPHDTTVKVAIISREYVGLEPIQKLRLDPDNDELINLDVQRFIGTRAQELSRFPGFNPEFKLEVEQELFTRAEGKFLWVGFAMAELLQKRTLSEVRDTMKFLPKGLPALYARMLHQIEPEHREMSLRILQWLALAIRPLSLNELTAALALKPSASLSAEQILSDCLLHCGPFVKVQGDEAGLVHQSARDYLLRQTTDQDPYLESFRIKPEQTHCSIAQDCLDCIMHSELMSPPANLKVPNKGRDPHRDPLLQYAIQYWPDHTRCASKDAERLLTHPSRIFNKKSPTFRKWEEVYRLLRSGLPRNSLHIACYLGIAPWVEAILRKDKQLLYIRRRVNRRNADGQTALFYAVRENHADIAELLLDHGADVAIKSNSGWLALHYAAYRGSEAATALLLDRGADTAVKDSNGSTPLHFAADGGSEAVVGLLLDHGANLNMKNNYGLTPLHYAANMGSEAAVRLLLNWGADVTIEDEYGCTALHYAVRIGSDAMIRLLETTD